MDPENNQCCGLCGRSVTADPVRGAGGRAFCSPGCRDVVYVYGDGEREPSDFPGGSQAEIGGKTLDSEPDDSSPGDSSGAEAHAGTDSAGTRDDVGREDGTVSSFFRVDGMSRPVDERYLEAVAKSVDGVGDAEASYVTETVRVDHDPSRASTARIREALTTLGYTAATRSRAVGTEDDSPAPGDRSGQTVAERKRSVEDLLSTRYVVGVVFGSFLLLPYVVFLYPTYIAPLVGGEFADLYGGAFENGGAAPILPLFAVVAGVVLLFTGLGVLRGGYVSLKLRRVTTDLLVSLTIVGAYLYSVLAMAAGWGVIYFDLTVVVAAVVSAVGLYETTAKRRALDRVTDLTVSQVTTARLADGDASGEVAVEDLSPGNRVLVREGERIPVDGTLSEGECAVDEAVVTGESLPVPKRPGDPVVGGSLVRNGAAVVTVGEGGSTMDRITNALWNVQSADHGIQRRVDRVAGVALAGVAVVALAAGGLKLSAGGDPGAALLGALLAGFVAIPWTLGVVSPLSVATAIGQSLDAGVVVFDDTVFERLRSVDVVVFDKTGTLTTGSMSVLDADVPEPSLSAAVALERRASHPAGEAIVQAYERDGNDLLEGTRAAPDAAPESTPDPGSTTDPGVRTDESGEADGPVPTLSVSSFRSLAAGVEGVVDGSTTLVGHPDLFADRDWTVGDDMEARIERAREAGRLPVLVGQDGAAEGVVVLGDEPRPGWQDVVARVADRGVSVVVLTGDDARAAREFEDHPGVDRVFAGVPPAGKVSTVRRIGDDQEVAMVGDGTNDAPALAAADLGIALETGTALAADAADVALVDDDLTGVTAAFDLSAAAGRRTTQNVAIAALYSLVTVPLAFAELANPLLVMLAAVGCCGLLAANSVRDLTPTSS